jgi:hypothetical protein
MKNIIKITILIFCFVSCKKEKGINVEKENIIKNDTMLNSLLKKQLEKGVSGVLNNSFDVETYDYSKEDFEVTLPILKEILVKNNYKVLDNNKFNERIKNIFGRIILPNSDKNYLFTNDYDICSKDINFYRNDNSIDIKPFGFYIVKNYNFITELYAIPEIFEYEKDYSQIENNLPEKFIDKDGEQIFISKWKDIPNLSQQRFKNKEILVNRNKYLFNDNKASFTWLKFNDLEFLQSLVKIYGYVEDEQLNKFVLDKNLKDNEGFGKVIYNKDCSGKLIFHEEIMKLIKSVSKEEKEKYLAAIINYFDYLRDTKDLSFSEKAEIGGKLAYYTTKIVGEESHDYFSFFPYVNGEEYQKEFENQNYYNIKDFKEIYDDTKTGGVSYQGMGE